MMHKPTKLLLAASSLVLALPLSGCALGGSRSSGFAGKVDTANVGVALRAQTALESGDAVTAVRLAEQAVGNSPNDAGFRTLLGNAYLAAGRFRSAEAAYGDALALIPGQAGVPLKLALTQAALGKSEAAFATLDLYASQIDGADAGLAMALAGRPGQAVELLDQVARAPEADARVRQNLALALALAGDWTRSRSIAAQDVPGDQLEARMSEWASLAQRGDANTRIAALIGVPAASSDAGMPTRLALRSAEQPVRMAEGAAPQAAVPAPTAAYEAPEPVEVAEAPAVPAPSLLSPIAEPIPVLAAAEPAAPQVAETAPDIAEMVDSIRREPVRTSGALPKVAELRRAAERRFGHSRAVVQLGAYATPAGVKAGWSAVSRRHRALKAYVPASARFNAPGGTVYRLSLKGFASDSEARQLCMTLKASGGSCFVRSVAGDAPVRFASR